MMWYGDLVMIKRAYNFGLDAVQRRAEEEDEGPVMAGRFTGHASVFDTPTLIGSRQFGFVERIARGAFDNVLEDDVRLLINHEGLPLARTTNGTLRLAQDDIGLYNEAEIADTVLGRDVVTLMERGDLNEMSFAFTIKGEEWNTYESDDELNGMELRTITEVARLYDTSLVTFPAYGGTDAGLRSLHVSDDEIAAALRVSGSDDREIKDRFNESLAARYSVLNNHGRVIGRLTKTF